MDRKGMVPTGYRGALIAKGWKVVVEYGNVLMAHRDVRGLPPLWHTGISPMSKKIMALPLEELAARAMEDPTRWCRDIASARLQLGDMQCRASAILEWLEDNKGYRHVPGNHYVDPEKGYALSFPGDLENFWHVDINGKPLPLEGIPLFLNRYPTIDKLYRDGLEARMCLAL